MKCEVFEGLAALRRDSRIGPAVRGCFELLWHLAGGRADYIVVTTKRIAYDFGVERRAVEKWIAKLGEYGLVEIIERDKRRGTIHLYIFHPRPDRRESRPDPQRRLDFPPTSGRDRLDLCAPKGPGGSGEASIYAPKGPAKPGEASTCAPKGPAGDNLSRACASDDSDDEEEFSSSSSLSLSAMDMVHGAIDLRRRLFPDRCPDLRHRDKVLLTSAVVIAESHGERGKHWLDESVELTIEHKPGKTVQYLKACLREGVATHLGRCSLADAPDEFARILLAVRPMVEKAIVEFREKRRAEMAAQQTAVRAGQEKEADA